MFILRKVVLVMIIILSSSMTDVNLISQWFVLRWHVSYKECNCLAQGDQVLIKMVRFKNEISLFSLIRFWLSAPHGKKTSPRISDLRNGKYRVEYIPYEVGEWKFFTSPRSEAKCRPTLCASGPVVYVTFSHLGSDTWRKNFGCLGQQAL